LWIHCIYCSVSEIQTFIYELRTQLLNSGRYTVQQYFVVIVADYYPVSVAEITVVSIFVLFIVPDSLTVGIYVFNSPVEILSLRLLLM